jgi:hypothetical protein
MQGDVLYAWEQSILKALKESGADIGNTSIADKFDGFLEAWVGSSYPTMPTLSFFTLEFYQITFNGDFNQI